MANLDRKFLEGLGVDDDGIINKIINRHNGATGDIERKLEKAEKENAKLTAGLATAKSEASDLQQKLDDAEYSVIESEEISKLNKELEKANAKLEAAEKASATLQGEFDTFKTTTETEKTTAAKKNALLEQLKADGADAKMADLLSSKFDIDKMELEDGKVKGWDELSKGVKAEYAEVFSVADGNPLNVGNPPPPGSKIDMDTLKNMTPEQINKEWDTVSGVLEAKK